MVDIFSVTLGLAVGLGVGGFATYMATRWRRSVGEVKAASAAIPLKVKLIEKVGLEKARRELKMLLLEKELLSAAITRVYEAEADGSITRDERDALSEKYREQLKSVNSKLSDVEVYIEVGELERLRDELVSLFEDKIGHIENRLSKAKARLDEMRGLLKAPPPVAVHVEAARRVERTVEEREKSEVDAKVKALKDEVLEALARLEQMDIQG